MWINTRGNNNPDIAILETGEAQLEPFLLESTKCRDAN
jgi:hypothetical protein